MKYRIDSVKSTIAFEIIKFKIGAPVEGKFSKFVGDLSYDEKTKMIKNSSAKIEATSIDTGNEKRDNHLRNEDFFHVSSHPQITFESFASVDLKNGAMIPGRF